MIRAATVSDIAAITAIYNDVIATTNAIYREDQVDVSERMAWFEDKS
jgi:phosphinothricin acetyltransferase